MKYSNANYSFYLVQDKQFAFFLNKTPKNDATSEPCNGCQDPQMAAHPDANNLSKIHSISEMAPKAGQEHLHSES